MMKYDERYLKILVDRKDGSHYDLDKYSLDKYSDEFADTLCNNYTELRDIKDNDIESMENIVDGNKISSIYIRKSLLFNGRIEEFISKLDNLSVLNIFADNVSIYLERMNKYYYYIPNGKITFFENGILAESTDGRPCAIKYDLSKYRYSINGNKSIADIIDDYIYYISPVASFEDNRHNIANSEFYFNKKKISVIRIKEYGNKNLQYTIDKIKKCIEILKCYDIFEDTIYAHLGYRNIFKAKIYDDYIDYQYAISLE